ncbi:DUF1688-domain-containing protein [Stereum hirsutum FP-91666 SS1]|uniref:DUF1688-domain-containing protein n=1 Tax=Stereum hirsutum (strain FP-91666) TaxID=721885 RepID=UPI000440B90C|nr:DUF1688-domain-containing protein [Stereum hirsutum FP-91666 SS1]EIM87514.1 DUF1688-domain-containing protein [Stereum hirsutum FP-91666 SS1]
MNLGNLGMSLQSKVEYLRTLPAIRERCGRVHDLAKQGRLQYFDYHPEQEDAAAEYCLQIIKRDFGNDYSSIPPHGRWRHLDAGIPRVQPLIEKWNSSNSPPDQKEITKRLLDLFLVSVLLDAGAGNQWVYDDVASGQKFGRSEGLGVASINMFAEGFFSGDSQQPYKVNAAGLEKVTVERTTQAMQASDSNPMAGLEGRTSLLQNLSEALRKSPEFFGEEGRPGNLLDFLETQSVAAEGGVRRVPAAALWYALIVGLAPIWPTDRTTLGGVPLGDVWPCEVLRASAKEEGDELVPFHKLTGWTTYSLVEPIEKVLGWKFEGLEDLTGLPEYRNGGLLLDLGVLSLKPSAIPRSFFPPSSTIPRIPPSHPAIIEWRAMTVIELDRLADLIRSKLGLSKEQLSLAQVLESATWKGGREIAKEKRPLTSGPPIDIQSDGTVF